MRAHEGSSATRHFLSFRVDQTRVGHIDSTLAADPASLRHNRPFGERLGEKQIEGCGQQKAITDQTIGRVKCRSEEHTSELQSLMRISYAVFCLKKKNNNTKYTNNIIK